MFWLVEYELTIFYFMIQSGFCAIGGASRQPRPQPGERHHGGVVPPSSSSSSPASPPHQQPHPGTPSSPTTALGNAHLPVQPFLKHQPATPLLLFRKWVPTAATCSFRAFSLFCFPRFPFLSVFTRPFFLTLCCSSFWIKQNVMLHLLLYFKWFIMYFFAWPLHFTDGKTCAKCQ